MNVQVQKLLSDHHKNVPLTVSGCSSVLNGNEASYGAGLALTPVSQGSTGFWHSERSELNPWIGFEMSSTFEVDFVEVDDRSDCDPCRGRWENVEVLVGPSSDINASGTQSCGTTSYTEGDTTLHYK